MVGVTMTTSVVPEDRLKVLEGMEMRGRMNVSDEVIEANVRYAIRQGHPQIRPQPVNHERVVLVGGGPSLADTERELVQLVHEGAKLVTVNGSYHWCLARNLRPSTQVILDARASNARFVDPPVPHCRYLLASTCHPAVWDAVRDREHVWIFHPFAKTDPSAAILDEHYLNMWQPILAGTTVTSRALMALRCMGYLRFDLFGVDSCWKDDQHHAYPQEENEKDKRYQVTVCPSDHPEDKRVFSCAPWHLKQLEDMLQIIKINGHLFALEVHGDGLLAHVLATNASYVVEEV